jgi:hypothetical protein
LKFRYLDLSRGGILLSVDVLGFEITIDGVWNTPGGERGSFSVYKIFLFTNICFIHSLLIKLFFSAFFELGDCSFFGLSCFVFRFLLCI